jgi:hypothetical protein
MLKLNADAVTVESFETQSVDEDVTTIAPPNDPTPATYCRWCPEPTFTCP